MAVLKIKRAGSSTWVDLTPDPYEMTVAIQDLDLETGAGRSQTGTMFRDRVAVKRKVSCKWRPMYGDKIKTLLELMQDVFFELDYPDPLTGGRKQITCYVGDRTMPVYTMYKGTTKSEILYNGLEANFIEK